MTPEQWLERHGKKPYNLGAYWYWGNEAHSDDPEDDDFLLPADIFSRLQAKTTYPNVKMYFDAEEAMADFRQAWNSQNCY